MTTLLILPTQLFSHKQSFWKQWDKVILIEDAYYINNDMHPMKLWMHRASMLEYYESIPCKRKRYIKHDQVFDIPIVCVMFHPTDETMMSKYKHAQFIATPAFMLGIDELADMDTPVQNVFYKRMRVKYNILMDGNKPLGNKWSFDSSNRQKYPETFKDMPILERALTSKYITAAKSITKISKIRTDTNHMPWATNRRRAISDLKSFIKNKLNDFGPYQDAIRNDVLVGNHSCISAAMNIGLITPMDVFNEVKKIPTNKVRLESLEGFIRQVFGWREYIRMKYILYGLPKWSYLKGMDRPLPKSWYTASTGIETLDWSIKRVLDYAYAPHIERLMLLLNYATLLRLKYDDVVAWFTRMYIDSFDWVMVNVSMGVNSLSTTNRFMTRVYLNNGNYLKRLGLRISVQDMAQLKELYERFIIDNKDLCKRDYRLAAQVKRLTK